ncbi:hypothetical protein HHI36_018098 [Cryptolaemus montrouzieri]|uniref:Uncharacterized protein n=1 Tax=Cryptolaemus montrouzieri TaxID=559131 RepID=A0ABD2NZ51_9CUCU
MKIDNHSNSVFAHKQSGSEQPHPHCKPQKKIRKQIHDYKTIETRGNGYGAATLLASRGCKVIIADCVNAEKSRDEIIRKTQNPNISYKHLDLSSLNSVREFCDDIKKSEKKIDILINNAGIGVSSKIITEDGLNYVMQVNFFGAFLLTHLLLEPLKAAEAARVIFVSSITVHAANLKLENLNSTDYTLTSSHIKDFYANSKLCNIIAAQGFGRRLEKYGITANSLDPLLVKTQIFRKTFEVFNNLLWKLLTVVGIALFGLNEVEAAETYLHLASSEKLDNKTGGHYAACSRMYKPRILKDEVFCEKIWSETEKLVKLKPEEKL